MREGLDLHFVDEAGRSWWKRCCLGSRRRDDALRHQRGRVDAALREVRMMGESTVELDGIGINQQLRWIEAQAARRLPRSFGAEAIARSRGDAGNEAEMHVAQA